MALARTFAVALTGMRGDIVEVEADISAGLPAFVLIGLPDAALGESRKRVSAAAANAGCALTQRKLTVNLSPASLRKQGSGFDLAIAVAALAASGEVPAESAARAVHVGELGLDGRLRPVPGVLPVVLAARNAGFARVLVPTANAEEASLVDGVEVVPVVGLRAAAIVHGAELDPIEQTPVALPDDIGPVEEEPDMADVAGNDDAVDAFVAAAAGGHNVSMIGPPGAGKTMLARRLPSLLPDLTTEQALETTSIRSLSGRGVGGGLVLRPPFEAPHHTASSAALVGGGSGRLVPGAIARASNGVLFLDEAGSSSRTSWTPCASRWSPVPSPSTGRPEARRSPRASSSCSPPTRARAVATAQPTRSARAPPPPAADTSRGSRARSSTASTSASPCGAWAWVRCEPRPTAPPRRARAGTSGGPSNAPAPSLANACAAPAGRPTPRPQEPGSEPLNARSARRPAPASTAPWNAAPSRCAATTVPSASPGPSPTSTAPGARAPSTWRGPCI